MKLRLAGSVFSHDFGGPFLTNNLAAYTLTVAIREVHHMDVWNLQLHSTWPD